METKITLLICVNECNSLSPLSGCYHGTTSFSDTIRHLADNQLLYHIEPICQVISISWYFNILTQLQKHYITACQYRASSCPFLSFSALLSPSAYLYDTAKEVSHLVSPILSCHSLCHCERSEAIPSLSQIASSLTLLAMTRMSSFTASSLSSELWFRTSLAMTLLISPKMRVPVVGGYQTV